MSKWLLAVLICIITVFSSTQTFAQEEDIEYSWGTVKSISSSQIVVTEYDYDNDEDVEATYSVDPKVELIGVKSLEDIAVGDSLDIEYIIQSGKKIAKVITVEKLFKAEEQEEYVPIETYDEEWEYPQEESGSTETSEPEFK